MPVFKSGSGLAPKWCDLEFFDIVRLGPGQTHTFARVGKKEKLLIGGGRCKVSFEGKSVDAGEGAIVDGELHLNRRRVNRHERQRRPVLGVGNGFADEHVLEPGQADDVAEESDGVRYVGDDEVDRAAETRHSTARQAAEIARDGIVARNQLGLYPRAEQLHATGQWNTNGGWINRHLVGRFGIDPARVKSLGKTLNKERVVEDTGRE